MTGDTVPPANLRNEYAADLGLTESNLAGDWYTQFDRWFTEVVAAGLPEPNAMVLGTADRAGRPSARTVLLKGYDPDGFVLFTNYGSHKGTELAANPYASLVFPWFMLQRQVVVTGRVDRLDRAETEAYFASRPRGSQLGAWASEQSRCFRTGRRWTTRTGPWRSATPTVCRSPPRRTGAAFGCVPKGGVLAGSGESAARPVAVPFR